jgi:AraC-like DNA-binding protein
MGLERTNDNGLDLPPEYHHYQDEGCEFAESCLNCPLPVCIYEEPGGRQRLLKRQRAREMTRLFTDEGKGVKELAQIYGVSRRTVQRALKTTFNNSTRRAGR